ncbi:MAG: 50S ribosomal protein L9 [Candidatus Altimarinota bacterium]
MQSKISVELLLDIAHMGRKGDIIEVTAAQARNFLIPKKMAREVTPERLKQIAEKEKRSKDQARERLEKAFDIQKMIDGQIFEFTLKGVGTKVFGGLDEHAIATKVNEKFGIHFEKNDIKLPNKTHIKKTGTHLVYLHITRDTMAKIIVDVKVEEK